MRDFTDHILHEFCPLREVLTRLNELGRDAVVFVTDTEDMLLGSITDGDIEETFPAKHFKTPWAGS